MLARASMLFLLAGICCAGEVEPKARPRLPPMPAREVSPTGDHKPSEPAVTSSYRSFDEFLQAKSRRPAGLEMFRETPATRTVASATEDKVQTSTDPNQSSSQTDPDILVLPKVEITAEKLTKLETQLAELAAHQSWEAKSAEAWEKRTVVDAILNPPFLKLGSYSGNARATIARQRVEVLNWVRILAIALKEAKTPGEKARIRAEIGGLQDIMRMWP